MMNIEKETIYSERRKIILRTAEVKDSNDYVYQCFPNTFQKGERAAREKEIVKDIIQCKDGTSIVTILRKSDSKFIGFIYTKSMDAYRNAITIEDLDIPILANRRKYAVDSLKQFVKMMGEQKLCETILIKEKYGTIIAEKYIKEFKENYDLQKLMSV